MTAFRDLMPQLLRRRPAPWLMALLLGLLLATQTLALRHGIEHGPGRASPAQLQAADAGKSADAWGHALDSGDCRLLDHVAQHLAFGQGEAAPQLPLLSQAFAPSMGPAPRLALHWRTQARAPPQRA